MQEYIMCSDGKKRKAIRIVCENCSKETLQRIRRKSVGRFCSKDCASTYHGKTHSVDVVCKWCSKQFRKRLSNLPKSKSGLYFCTRACKDEAQKLGGIKEIQPPHYGTSTIVDYRAKFDSEDLVCTRCGYNEFRCAIDIHHIDKNRDNNDIANLVPLCSCCHMSLHRGAWKIEEIMGHVAT